ncbi:hypothetical protein ASG39_00050 [Rhizobium sp. Leaf371]|uniref:hypothetical protein n=1 Tax=Rhizobium sp. Leaf371 TaxID=1736355 RepID=UPI000715E2F0|nr:hypothetical protein [Rhizobium sp. Leaf371]KQS72226.1 hypothetical protein ASG39_00050 [Rhizobium sp. Leaf371]
MDNRQGLEISRRGFLLGVASLPVAQEALAAEAPDSDTDLIFDLSPDEATVRVVRVARPAFESNDAGAAEGSKSADLSRQWQAWELHASAFGKNAFFDLEPRTLIDKDLEAAHALAVRDVSYGELAGGTVILRFYESDQGGRHWRVGMITDVWHSERGGRKQYHVAAKDGQPLSEMAKADGAARLSMTLTPARINKTFELLADGLIRCDAGISTVALDGAMNWHVNGLLSTFDGKVRLGDLTFGWQQESISASTAEARASTEALFLATAEVVKMEPLPLGTSKELPLTIHADSGGEGANFTLIGRTRKLAAFSSRDPSQSGPQAAAVAWIQPVAGQITTDRPAASAPIASFATLPFHEATISQTLSLSSKGTPRRTAFWGDAGLLHKTRPKDFVDPDPGDDSIGEVNTRIGRVRYRQVPAEKPGAETKDSLRTRIGKIISAALGDRSGVLQNTLYAAGDGRPSVVRRFSADLHLVGLDAALPDVQDSQLQFDPTLLRLAFTDGVSLTAKPGVPFYEQALAEPPAFIWLGPAAAGLPVARFDLLRAALKARGDRDLVDLTFRFADMRLDFTSTGLGYQRQIKPRADDCGVRSAVDGTVIDNRPILSVEFAPQHVMEEAFFQLEPPPLPDAPTFLERGDPGVKTPPKFMESAAAVLARLDVIPDEEGRRNFRIEVQARKIAMEVASRLGASTPSPLTFEHFAGLFGAVATVLPRDQKVYIGPLGLDPDGMDIARRERDKVLSQALAAAPAAIEKDASDLLSRKYSGTGGNPDAPDLTEALRREREIENELPVYRLWRDCWRDTVLDQKGSGAPLEWLMDGNRPKDGKFGTGDRFDKATKDKAVKLMIDRLSGQEEIPELAKARHSGPTFLAFHINCTPSAQDDPETNCLPAASGSSPKAPGGLGTSFSAFPFTFEALTDWSHHEPAVTRRARNIYSPTAGGELPPVADRAGDLDLNKMLVFQGISEAPHQTASQRMREIQASVNETPAPFETHIEIPSRVILSTAQDAVWSTKRRRPSPRRPTGAGACKAPSPVAQRQAPGQMPRSEFTAEPLWSARLMTTDGLRGLKPGVRVVDSPDFRPGALSRSEYPVGNETDRIPGEASPPRGKYAPWTLGRDQWEGGMQAQVCKQEEQGGTPRTGLVGWICAQFDIRSKLPDDVRFFRSSLDAYDRHELVLLSSTYGLPVLPAGNAAGGSQFKPNPEFVLVDGTGEQAVYVPKTLDLNELTLTALGGSLDHDTIFVPPAPARGSISGKAFFDGLSIERWQHKTVLGRDIIATVVYSGFLFPFGHKASLVKVTERVFHRSKSGEIKAPLRQRMFIRVSDPDKVYPAVGHPNEGRRWCGRTVKLITKTTPDIVDPMISTTGIASNAGPGDVELNGRIKFSGSGLAFWPKTSLSDSGLVSFDLEIDGRPTSLPLMFVDKATTQYDGSVKTVVDHYNQFSSATRAVGDEDARCKVQMGGQTLEFAPSKVSGDTTFATDTIVLRAEARYAGDGSVSWSQDNTEYGNIQALESASQPPFYPIMGAAHIRIEQVETLTGETGRSVRVKYDGHYVRNGFAVDQSTTSSAVQNPAEVFLCIADHAPPRLGMGAKGEQAGALAQPNALIAALGRKSGPLGGTEPSYSLRPGFSTKLFVALTPSDPRQPAEEMFSLAEHFSMGTTTLTKAGEGSTAASTTYKDFFADDAKLLGVIKLRDLIDFLDISGATDALPVLKEAVEFGTEALASLQSGARDGLDLVRREILVPLRELTRRVREQWADLDRRLREKQRGLDTGSLATGPLSVKTIYPEIDAGLASLDEALDRAIANEDPVLALAMLAEVHEAGKSLGRQLAVIASNPIERVEAEIRRRIDAFTADVSRLVNVVVSQVRIWADAVKATLTEQVFTLVDDLFQDGTDAFLAFLGLPLPLEIIDRTANAISDANAAAVLVDNLRPILGRLDGGSIKATVRDQLRAVQADPSKAKAAVIRICEAVYQSAKTQLDEARAELKKSSLSDELKTELLAWLDAYGVEIERLLKAVQAESSDLLASHSEAVELVIASKRRLTGMFETIKRLLDSRDEIHVRREVVRIAGDWMGTDLASVSRLVAGNMAKAIRPWAGGARTRVQAFLGGAIPRLPGGAGAFALAGDLQKSAEIIESSSGDPMADFARIIVQSAAALTKIAEVRDGIPTQVPDLTKMELVKTCNNLADSIRATQGIFQTTILLRHHAENTGDGLETLLKAIDDELATVAPDNQRIVGLVTAFGHEVRRVASIEKTLFAAFIRDAKSLVASLSRQAGLIGLAVLAGALADALKGTRLEARAQAVKDFADQSEAELAKWTLRCVKWVAASAASLADPSSNLTGQLPVLAAQIREARYLALFDPERSELAGSIDDLGRSLAAGTGGINQLATAVASLAESTALAQLVEILQPIIVELRLDEKLLKIARSASQVTIDGSRLASRARGLPGMLQARAEKVRANAEQYALQQLKDILTAEASKLEDNQRKVLAIADPWAAGLVDKIHSLHRELTDNRDKVYGEFALGAGAFLKIKQAIVVGPIQLGVKPEPFDDLRREQELLSEVQVTGHPLSDASAREKLRSYLENYGEDRAALQKLGRQIRAVARDLERGDLLTLIDVGALREEIEERIAELVPLKRTLKYQLDFAFKDLPANPIAEIFQPKRGGRFSLEMAATIDLLKFETKMTARGRIDAFDIKLVGGFIDALTLSFEGAEFSFDGGGSAKFDVFYRDFKIGPALKFIEELQAWLKPNKDGSGFFIEPARGVPGIKAGYGISLPIIMLGNVSFSNISLNTAVILPFDGSEALFEISLGRPTSLFRIAASPYAGGGFLAVTANVDGVKGFEMSLAFGGGGAFQAGPLVGQGFIDTGIYIRTMTLSNGKRITDLYGTFYAGGAASIWIFHFAASLYVRLGMTGGTGSMEGVAIFTFSFSMGIVDYDYRCEMRKSQGALSNGSTQSIAPDRRPSRAPITIDHDPNELIDPMVTDSTTSTIDRLTHTRRKTKGLEQDPNKFMDYFDLLI